MRVSLSQDAVAYDRKVEARQMVRPSPPIPSLSSACPRLHRRHAAERQCIDALPEIQSHPCCPTPQVKDVIERSDFGRRYVTVRVNVLGSAWWTDDIATMATLPRVR